MPHGEAPYPALELAFVRQVRQIQGEDPLARILLLVGHPILGRYLLRRLARDAGAVVAVVPMTLRDVARRLAARPLGERGLRPLPSAAARVLAADLLDSLPTSHPFAACRALPGVPALLWRTLQTLRLAGVTAPAVREAIARCPFEPTVTARLVGLVEVLQKLETALEVEHGCDEAQAFRLATSEAQGSSWLRGFRAVISYGRLDPAPLEARLLDEVVSVISERHAFAGAPPALQDLAGPPFPELRLLSVPGPERGGHELARELVDEARRGRRWHDMAVLVAGGDREEERVARILGSLGIPCYRASGESLAVQRSGRILVLLLEVLARNFPRLATVELLQALGPDLERKVCDHRRFDAGLLEAATARAMIRSGADAWQRMSERRLARLASPEQRDEADSLRAATSFVSHLSEAGSRLPREAPAADMSRVAVEILRQVMRPSERRLELERVLHEMSAWRSGARLDRKAFRALVEECLAEERTASGTFGTGHVFVGSVTRAEGLCFPAVFVSGLDAPTFPSPVREDPLFLDDERQVLGEHLAVPLPFAAADPIEQRRLFELAAHSATDLLLLSWSRTDEAGEPQSPSPLLLDFLSSRCGCLVTGRDLDARACPPGTTLERDGFTMRSVSLSRLVPQGFGGLASCIDEREVAMRLSSRLASRNRLARERPALLRLDQALRAPFLPILTARDGLLESADARTLLEAWLAARTAWSATAFERYAACPRSFMLGHVLGLEPLPRPEEADRMEPGDFGSLVHRVLERLFRGLAERRWPQPFDPADPVVRQVLEEAWEAGVREIRAAGRTGSPLHWEGTRRDARDRIEALLEWQARESDWRPHRFEVDISHFEIPLDGDVVLTLRGRLDRIDRSLDGRRARVVDYKTSAHVERPLAGGTTLQLPLYARAASSVLGTAVTVEEACYLWMQPDRRVKPISLGAADLADLQAPLRQALATIWEGIRLGRFFPQAGDDFRCRSCPFEGYCGRGIRVTWQRKQGDPVLAAFHAMRADSVAEPVLEALV